MIVKSDRSGLDAALNDPTSVMLLLRGRETGSPAQAVHDFFVANAGQWDPWHHAFLITGTAPLTPEEKQLWFDGKAANRFAVLCQSDRNAPRRVAMRGLSTDLFEAGQPDLFKMLDVLQSCP